MKENIQEIFRKELKEEVRSYTKIEDLGSVNLVYDVKGKNENYILRLNDDLNKRIEYQKEIWCIKEIAKRGISTSKVLSQGIYGDHLFMIQTKVPGINGIKTDATTKASIWKKLGQYAQIYHQINRIENREVEEAEFHANWKSRLDYNLTELNEKDSLLQNKTFSQQEQENAKSKLAILQSKDFKIGLVHGDLCPRNVIVDNETIYLLDWGTAEINVVPHVELGILLMSDEVNNKAFQLFLNGVGISSDEYQTIEEEINLLSLLHGLDKYRWAETYDLENINDYALKVKNTYQKLSV